MAGRRKKERDFEDELLKGLDELDAEGFLEEEISTQERDTSREELKDSSSRFYEEIEDKSEDYGNDEPEEEEEELSDEEGEGDEEYDEEPNEDQEGEEKKSFLSSLSHKKVILFSVALVLILMIGAVALEFLLPPKKTSGVNAKKTMQFNQVDNSALQGFQPVKSEVDSKKQALTQNQTVSDVMVTVSVSEQQGSAAVSAEAVPPSQKPVVIEKKSKNLKKISLQNEPLKKETGTLNAMNVSNVQENKVKKESEKVSEDVFLTFFRVGNQQSVGFGVSPQNEDEEKDKLQKSGLPVLGAGGVGGTSTAIPPLGGMNVNMDKIQVYAVVCDEAGQNCFAETNLGRLKAGDVISGGFETITSISKNEIRTNVRIIGF